MTTSKIDYAASVQCKAGRAKDLLHAAKDEQELHFVLFHRARGGIVTFIDAKER